MSITSALKKLAKNVFNVNTTGDNIDEILDDIANNASGGSGGSGDRIKITSTYDESAQKNVYDALQTGLTPEDFVGAYVRASNGGFVGIITAAGYQMNNECIMSEFTSRETTYKLYYGVDNGLVSESADEVAPK